MRAKKCKKCGKSFKPTRSTTEVVCSYKCAIAYQREDRKKKEQKEWRKEKKQRLEKLKTHKDWLKDLEKVFNQFVRERDKGKPCVSCDKEAGTFTLTAGHYFPAGHYANVRFDEDNVHGQCWWNCNRNKHGNQIEYRKRLVERIGEEGLNELEVRARQSTLKLTIPEIKELITLYKSKIKEL